MQQDGDSIAGYPVFWLVVVNDQSVSIAEIDDMFRRGIRTRLATFEQWQDRLNVAIGEPRLGSKWGKLSDQHAVIITQHSGLLTSALQKRHVSKTGCSCKG